MHPSQVSIGDQIRAVKRELALRRVVYERRIASGKMTREQSHQEITTMEAVLMTLEKAAYKIQQERQMEFLPHNPPR